MGGEQIDAQLSDCLDEDLSESCVHEFEDENVKCLKLVIINELNYIKDLVNYSNDLVKHYHGNDG